MRIMLPVCDLFLLGLQFCNACMIRQFDSKQPVQFGCHVNFILKLLKTSEKMVYFMWDSRRNYL